MSERLSRPQINILKLLAVRCGAGGNILLNNNRRRAVAPLWRRGIVEIWYRQTPEVGLQGPYFGLSLSGSKLAAAFHHHSDDRCEPRLGRQGQLE